MLPQELTGGGPRALRPAAVVNGVLFVMPVLAILIAAHFANGWAAIPISLAVCLATLTYGAVELQSRLTRNSDYTAQRFWTSWLAYSIFFIAPSIWISSIRAEEPSDVFGLGTALTTGLLTTCTVCITDRLLMPHFLVRGVVPSAWFVISLVFSDVPISTSDIVFAIGIGMISAWIPRQQQTTPLKLRGADHRGAHVARWYGHCAVFLLLIAIVISRSLDGVANRYNDVVPPLDRFRGDMLADLVPYLRHASSMVTVSLIGALVLAGASRTLFRHWLASLVLLTLPFAAWLSVLSFADLFDT